MRYLLIRQSHRTRAQPATLSPCRSARDAQPALAVALTQTHSQFQHGVPAPSLATTLTRPRLHRPAQVLSAARALLAKGSARLVLVKHLAHAGLEPDASFEMLLVSREEAWHVATPQLPFSRPPVGTGDLTSALFLVGLLHGRTPRAALEHTASAYFEVSVRVQVRVRIRVGVRVRVRVRVGMSLSSEERGTAERERPSLCAGDACHFRG